MVVLVEGGVKWSWASTPAYFIAYAVIALVIVFIHCTREKKATEPMMPFRNLARARHFNRQSCFA